MRKTWAGHTSRPIPITDLGIDAGRITTEDRRRTVHQRTTSQGIAGNPYSIGVLLAANLPSDPKARIKAKRRLIVAIAASILPKSFVASGLGLSRDYVRRCVARHGAIQCLLGTRARDGG